MNKYPELPTLFYASDQLSDKNDEYRKTTKVE